jgi:FkbM family methyltransferase
MYSQIGQDAWVLSRIKDPGFFVDIGATNGIEKSNTYALELAGWRGICVEPNPHYFEELVKNRKCTLSPLAIYKESDLDLNLILAGEYSSLLDYANDDHHYRERAGKSLQKIKTITLDKLLAINDAPNRIDYLSLDTEGAELEILESFSWDYDIQLITIEHNNGKNKEPIAALLEAKGYKKAIEESHWEHWYEKGQ